MTISAASAGLGAPSASGAVAVCVADLVGVEEGLEAAGRGGAVVDRGDAPAGHGAPGAAGGGRADQVGGLFVRRGPHVSVATGVLDGLAVHTAWQQPIVDSVAAAIKPQLAFADSIKLAVTGPPLWSKGVLNAMATQTAWQNSIVERAVAAALKPQLDFLGPVRLFENNWASSYTSPLKSIVLQAPFQSSLHQVADQIVRVFTEDLFSTFDTLRELFRDWLPDNLREVGAGLWM